MKCNISHEPTKLWLARTTDGERLIVIRPNVVDVSEPEEGDVLVLRGAVGGLIPACYAGIAAGYLPDDQSEYELAGVYAVDPDGVELSSLIDGNVGSAGPSGTQHDWGTMGLPDGPRTRVSPAFATRDRDDVRLALESDGHRQYATNRRLSIGAGDPVLAAGGPGTVVRVDRRDRLVEVEFNNGTTQTIAFDEIAELEER